MGVEDTGVSVSFTDLDSTETELGTIYLQSNPVVLAKSLAATYAEHAPVGFTGTHKNFVGNANMEFPVTVWYYANNKKEYERLIEAERFITAMLYPSDATDIKTNAPPRILFSWPNNFSAICRAETVTIEQQQFDRDGHLTMFEAVVNLFTVADQRLIKSTIKSNGITFNNDVVEI